MAFSIVQTIWEQFFPQKRLKCPTLIWEEIHRELKKRGQGHRESGGFLLGYIESNCRHVKAFLPYDEIDPASLRGHIVFDGSKMDLVWRECKRLKMRVIADVHTHPRGYQQSSIDQENPMIPERGHIALIVPYFAKRIFMPGEIGIYEFLGGGRWLDHSSRGSKYFSVGRF